MYYNYRRYPVRMNNGDRFIGGGFLGPFILGGITGGLVAPAFYRPPAPIYYNTPIPPGPFMPYPGFY